VYASLADKTEITLQWEDNAGAGFSHRVRQGSIIIEDALDGNATSVVISGLTSGVEYGYEVCAYDTTDEYCANTKYTKTADIPIPVSLAVVGSPTKNTIEISWVDSSTTETHFRIRRIGVSDFINSLVDITDEISLDAPGSGSTQSFEDIISAGNDVASTSYYYQICAVVMPNTSEIACSALFEATTADLVLPIAPQNFSVNPGDETPTSIDISWINGGNSDSYRIERRKDGVLELPVIDIISELTTSYKDEGLLVDTLYSYKICAINSDGETCTNPLGAKTEVLPARATLLNAASITQTGFTLNWTDNASNETEFLIKQRVNGVTVTNKATVNANIQTVNITGLSVSTTYEYQVCADYYGSSLIFDGATCSATLSVTTIPNAPTSTPATGLTENSVTLNWVDNDSNESGYYIYRNGSIIATLGADLETYADTTVLHSTTYSYMICAYTSGGEA